MKSLFIPLLLFTLLEGGMDWAAYKETLFVGEPIILIKKFKNTEDKPMKIIEFYATYPNNTFSIIYKRETFKFSLNYEIDYAPYTDSILVMPKDSVYSSTLLFWKDFWGKENKHPAFPMVGERCKICINNIDTIPLFFKAFPKAESEVFEAMKNYHIATVDESKLRARLLKNFRNNKSALSPYLYYLQFLHGNLPTKIKTVGEMKKRFPKHILTEWTEVRLMWRLYEDRDPKNEEVSLKLRNELVKKYPSNIGVRKELKVSWKKR